MSCRLDHQEAIFVTRRPRRDARPLHSVWNLAVRPSVRPFVRPLAGRAVVDVSCVDFETWVLGLINFAFCKQIAFSYSGKHGPVPTRTITEPFTNPSKVGPETPES